MTSTTEQLKIVIVGHVDHGKSTFVGRLFHDTGSLPEGKLEQLQQIAERRGVPFEWANLMDALQSERDQNITIDTAQIWFRTARRQYVIIDAPGHKEFLKNMITGAASAEAALLLIDAQEGVQEQSRRHGYLLNLLGIRQIAVLVNKMDLVGYGRERFEQIEREYRVFLQTLGVTPKLFIPISAKHGDNLAKPSQQMPWWSGPTVVEALDGLAPEPPPLEKPLRFVVQDVYRFDHRRILAGRVESGIVNVGDRLLFCPSNKVSTVKSIEQWSAPTRQSASAGESIGITLTEQIFVERGAVAALETAPPYELTRFKARLFWLGHEPFRCGRTYKLKLATQEVECEIDRIEKVIDASTLATVERRTDGDRGSSAAGGEASGSRTPQEPGGEGRLLSPALASAAGGGGDVRSAGEEGSVPTTENRITDNSTYVARHEVAEVYLRTRRPVAFDAHAEIVPTGRFVIVDGYEVAGGGIVAADGYPRRTADSLHKSHDIYWSEGKVTADQRARRNTHPGCIVWLTGLSGAGKSTIATELERELFNLGKHAYVLDGDKVRHGLCSDLAFSPEDRRENIRRVGEVAKLFADAGLICITAFISPYRSDRELVRRMMQAGEFIEVYVNAPIAVCEQRDPKGLYAKARANKIKEFTGISAPYESPDKPELELHTDLQTVAESVTRVLEYLQVQDVDAAALI